MIHIFGIAIAIGLFIFVLWLLNPSSDNKSASKDDIIFDSSDPRQIGFLIGMTGGSIPTAVVAQFALKRFEKFMDAKLHPEISELWLAFPKRSNYDYSVHEKPILAL